MKIFRSITALMLVMFLLFNLTSCFVIYKKDNGRHKGWHKSQNNPHHPVSTNPGKANGKANGHHKK